MDSLNHEKQGPEPTTTPALPSEEPPTQVSLDQSPDEKHVGPQTIPTLRLVAISTGYVSHPPFSFSDQNQPLTPHPHTRVALGLFLSMLDSSIVATSLFTIAVEFEDVDRINWVALAYTLTYLSCAVLFARISDVIGRRAAFAGAYVVFIAFSLACGFARGMGELIAFRALQGLGGSGEFFFLRLSSICLVWPRRGLLIGGI
jgi:hypothetical protein